MAVLVEFRKDCDGVAPRRLAGDSRDGQLVRRLLVFAAIHDGAQRSETAQIDGVRLQTRRNWVLQFDALGPLGLVGRKPPRQAPLLSVTYR